MESRLEDRLLDNTVANEEDEKRENSSLSLPDMWSWNHIGLYAQYGAVGLIYGANQGTMFPFCFYVFNGASNLCANGLSISGFAWSIKILFALVTESYRPFGMRRRPWMIFGWLGVLIILLVLACTADKMSTTQWLITLLFLQCFMMFSDVPADGMSVELARLEPAGRKGQILATGQMVRYFFCIIAGCIQTFMLNGTSTNMSGCKISFDECWGWGLTINQYYGLMFALVFLITLPIYFLEEPDASGIPQRTMGEFLNSIWRTLQTLTAFRLLIFIILNDTFTNIYNNVNIYLQYDIIQLTNFQAGIDSITTNLALFTSIYVLKRYIGGNWRLTQRISVIGTSFLGLLWIPAYYNSGGTMNAWYTIFVDVDYYLAQGVTRVLYSLAVLPLQEAGQEATLFELIVNAGNSAQTLKGILATQLLTPMKAAACESSSGCSSDSVSVTSKDSFDDTHGPERYTNYTLLLSGIGIAACILFTPFFPNSVEECEQWKAEGKQSGAQAWRGYVSATLAVLVIAYGIVAAVLLMDVKTSCEPYVGGSGC